MSADGVRAAPEGTLVDRALRALEQDATDSLTLARDVLGIRRATRTIAERVAAALLGADPRVRQLADGRWSLAREERGTTRLDSCAFAVVDVETTGSRPAKGDRVTEIAVVVVSGGEAQIALDTLVNPERRIPRIVSGLTRITDDMVRDAPAFDDIADDVLSALAGRVFVAHNMRFDWGFLTRELRRARHLALEGPRLCTVQLARRLVPQLRSRNLDSLAEYFGVEIGERHRARGDALAAAQILQKLLGLAEERGAVTVADLRELGRPRRRRKKKRTAMPTSMSEL